MEPDIHVNPGILRAGAQQIVNAGIANWQAQKKAYEEAYEMLSPPRGLYWVGGHGGTGRVRDAGDAFLDWLATTVQAKIAELDTFIAGMQSHSDNLIALADRTEQADLRAAEHFRTIARGFEGGAD